MIAARVLLLVALFGLLAPAPASAAAHHVMIRQFAYSSASLIVGVGDQVTWTNHDEAPHDVVAGTFRSPLLNTGQSWTYTFTAPGSYAYYCSVHPDMRAQVVVLPVETPTQQAPAQPRQTVKPSAPPTTAAPTTTTTAVQAPAASSPQQQVAAQATAERLDPMLIVAGVVAAIAILCLLLIGARPES